MATVFTDELREDQPVEDPPSPPGGNLHAMFELPAVAFDRIVTLALEEDLASGDITTESCIEAGAKALGRAVARRPLVACGARVFARVFWQVDPSLTVEVHVEEGALAPANTALWSVKGRLRSILMGERVALNFVQRMCGIATKARAFVDAVPRECRARITDTRKTTPGLRAIERYAVRVGGARNHRDDLGAAVLIKDNHVAACGGVRQAIERARALAPHTAKIECEVDSLEQLDEALAARVDIVLLDNMTTTMVIEAVARVRGRALVEASGGITLDRVAAFARAGVDAISVGGLTHSVESSDVGLDLE